jgi:hypothetical protein
MKLCSENVQPNKRSASLPGGAWRRLPGIVINFANRGDYGFWLVELDVFRAVAGEYLFGVGRESEPARLSQCGLLRFCAAIPYPLEGFNRPSLCGLSGSCTQSSFSETPYQWSGGFI